MQNDCCVEFKRRIAFFILHFAFFIRRCPLWGNNQRQQAGKPVSPLSTSIVNHRRTDTHRRLAQNHRIQRTTESQIVNNGSTRFPLHTLHHTTAAKSFRSLALALETRLPPPPSDSELPGPYNNTKS
jgi:hypothetical protein